LIEGGKEENKVHSEIINGNDTLIMCNAFVLHIHDENALKRYIYKMDDVSVEKFLSPRKGKAFLNHLLKTAGIGATIIFLVILSHESLLSTGRHESLEVV
jgi:hypothetical protein